MKLPKWLPHWHLWKSTAHNKWGICIERKCAFCEKYQWHGMDHRKKGDFFATYFVDGEHPNKSHWKSHRCT